MSKTTLLRETIIRGTQKLRLWLYYQPTDKAYRFSVQPLQQTSRSGGFVMEEYDPMKGTFKIVLYVQRRSKRADELALIKAKEIQEAMIASVLEPDNLNKEQKCTVITEAKPDIL
jgi:hypothetical protein